MAQNAEEQRTAAYVAWGTFRNQLDSLARTGIPNRIDRSAFIGLAGGTQTQLIHAMRFLDLVDGQGNPTPLLKEAVSKDELERKKVLEGAFRESYADLFALNLEKATPDQFLETLEKSYKVTGSTRRKAATFFLKGVKWLGIGVSPFLEKAGKAAAKAAGTNGSPRRRRAKNPPAGDGGTGPQTTPPIDRVPEGLARQDIPTIAGAYIMYPVEMSEEDFKLFEAALQFVKAVTQKGGQ